MPAQTTTPTVASHVAGFRPMRKVANSVRSPPSSRITASATLPTQKLSLKSSKTSPPGPSTPARVPTTRNASRKENPARAENTPASTLKKIREAAPSKGKVRKSREIAVMDGWRYQKKGQRPIDTAGNMQSIGSAEA